LTDVIWSGPARKDLFGIADWYDEHAPEYSEIILGRIEHALDPLIANHLLGEPFKNTPIRKWRVRKTPFILLYKANRSRIEIRRVVHSATNWQPSSI